jgi:repressor LexA
MTKESIAKILRKLRIDAKMTQQQVADAIGRKQSTVASWETGQSQPDADTLFQLCDLYKVSADEAFGYSSRKKAEAMTDSELNHAIEKEGQELVELINRLSPQDQRETILEMVALVSRLSPQKQQALAEFLRVFSQSE